MKLLRLQIENFRQFVGRTAIEFATDPQRPVTLFHGANGGGKTCLLNTFTWVMFGEFTAGMKDKEPDKLAPRLAIESAKVGDEIRTSVILQFEHGGREYTLRRVRVHQKVSQKSAERIGDDEVRLSYCDSGGEAVVLDKPHRLLRTMIPEKLHGFFFIDGERIFDLSRTSKRQREELQDATRTIMGIESIDRALRHLRGGRGAKGIKRILEDEFEEHATDELKSMLAEQHEKEQERDDLKASLEEAGAEKDALEKEHEELVNRLRSLAPAKHLQDEREQKEADIEDCKARLEKVATELRRIITQKGYLAPLAEPAKHAVGKIDELRERGELPAGIKRPFVDDLLGRGNCICGRALSEDDGSREALLEWKRKAGLADLEERAFELRGKFRGIDDQIKEFWKDLDDSLAGRSSALRSLDDAEDRHREVSKELKKLPQEDVVAVEQARIDCKRRLERVLRTLGERQGRIKELDQQIRRSGEEIRRQKASAEKQALAQRRLSVCLQTIEALETLRELYEAECRTNLNRELENVFKRINFKGYKLVLDDDYQLELRQVRAGRETKISPSQGENQVMVLAFITSIIDTLRKRKSDDPVVLQQDYPLVLDSPFGQLDGEHRTQVASVIPQLTPQVVLLLSDTQWDKWVESKVLDKVGKEYVISYKASEGSEHVVRERSMTLGTTSYSLVQPTPSEDYAELLEVSRS